MGFGSYDESEQREVETEDFAESDTFDTGESAHDGSIEFENGATSDELLERLKEIKDEE